MKIFALKKSDDSYELIDYDEGVAKIMNYYPDLTLSEVIDQLNDQVEFDTPAFVYRLPYIQDPE